MKREKEKEGMKMNMKIKGENLREKDAITSQRREVFVHHTSEMF